MILYLDTSALVKLYCQETESEQVKELVKKAEIVGTCRISYVEAKAAFSRKYWSKELTKNDFQKLISGLEKDWPNYLAVEISTTVVEKAGDLVSTHNLRAYDALHIAAAQLLKEKSGLEVLFLTFDRDQKTAAIREGLKVPLR